MEIDNKKQGILVALCGAKCSGKTTLADLLCADRVEAVRENGYTVSHTTTPSKWKRISFSGVLKDMLITMGVDSSYIYENKEEPIPYIPGQPTARKLMQTLGTEWGREMLHENIWVALTMYRVKSYLEDGWNIVIDDMRFPNEEETVLAHGGIIVGISRIGLNSTDGHSSESHWVNMQRDYGLLNDGSPEELLKQFNRAMEDYHAGS